MGCDRSQATGTGFAAYYSPALRAALEKPETTPVELLLFFHNLPWETPLALDATTGAWRLAASFGDEALETQTLIEYIQRGHTAALEEARQFGDDWAQLEGQVDGFRHSGVRARLAQQLADATTFKELLVGYWTNLTKQEPPARLKTDEVQDISLLDHGAVCDGVHADTAAFRSALAAAGAAVRGGGGGGGNAVVRVPGQRTCVTGPFNITSDRTTLYLEAGSVVKASDDPALWPAGHPLPTFGPRALFSAFVGFYSVNGSGIDGTGSLDMNGQAWHGGRLDPKNDYKNLPHFVMVHGSAHVRIRGVSLLNGANWNVHLVYSTHCSVDGISIITPFKGTDGVDVDSSTHIVVKNSFISNGDDCIAIKSGFDCFGIQMHRPSSDILISNMTCTKGGSIAVGSEMSGGVANVLIEDCLMYNNSGPILSYRWTQHRGGFIRNITARNIRVEGKIVGFGDPDNRAVMWVQSNYGCEDIHCTSKQHNAACPQPEPLAPTAVSDIVFENVSGWVPLSTPAGILVGLDAPGLIEGISFKDINLVAGPWQCVGATVTNLTVDNVSPPGLMAACATKAKLKSDDGDPAPASVVPAEARVGNTVTLGQVRVTVHSASMLRAEWSSLSQFEDRPSVTFLNRSVGTAPFTHSVEAGGVLVVRTANVELRYDPAAASPPPPPPPSTTPSPYFAPGQLKLSFVLNSSDGRRGAWSPADAGSTDSCRVWGQDRRPCGDAAVTESRCAELGCCYRAFGDTLNTRCAAGDGTPACFHPQPVGMANLNASNDVFDCYAGSKSCAPWYASRMVQGLVSRDGWAVHDDAGAALLDGAEGSWVGAGGWRIERPANRSVYSDWMIFAHGHDYRAALRDFVAVAGPIAMMVKATCFSCFSCSPSFDSCRITADCGSFQDYNAYGVWYSKYWKPGIAEEQVRAIVAEYRTRSLPLHAFVLDVGWHVEESGAEASNCHGYGGYTWNKTLFADPAAFTKWMHEDENLKLMVNTHDYIGIDPCQAFYQDMARALGVDPSTNVTLQCSWTNKSFSNAVFTHALDARMNGSLSAIDYTWTDYDRESGGYMGDTHAGYWFQCPNDDRGASPLLWSTHVHVRRAEQLGRRGLVMAPFGGIG